VPGWLLRFLLACLALVCAGCGADDQLAVPKSPDGVARRAEYTLNPDGSGKVVCQYIGPIIPADYQPDGPRELHRAVQGAISRPSGVDAWADIACGRRPDRRRWVKGTVYFKDISKVNLPFIGSWLLPTCTVDGRGGMAVTVARQVRTDANKPGPLSDEQIAARIKKMRDQRAERAPMVDKYLIGAMTTEILFHLPGRVTETTHLVRGRNGALRIAFDGVKMLVAYNAVVADDAAMREVVLAGEKSSGPTFSRKLLERVLGSNAPIRARVAAPMKPQFNYAAEVAAANTRYPDMLRKAGVIPAKLPPPTEGYVFDKITVTDVSYGETPVFIRGRENPKACILKIDAVLSKPIYECLSGELYSAATDTGEVVFPRIGHPNRVRERPERRAGRDKTTVFLDVHVAVPEPGTKRLKEVTGVLNVVAADGTEEIDLGAIDAVGEVKRPQLGATLKRSTKMLRGEPVTILSVKMKMPHRQLTDMIVYGTDGKRLRSSQRWMSGRAMTAGMSRLFKGEVPAKTRIVVTVLKNFRQFEVPFRLTDVKLPAQPKP